MYMVCVYIQIYEHSISPVANYSSMGYVCMEHKTNYFYYYIATYLHNVLYSPKFCAMEFLRIFPFDCGLFSLIPS